METNKNFYTRYGLQLWEASEEFAKHCDGASYSDFRTFFCHVAYNMLLGYYNNTWRNVTDEEGLDLQIEYFTGVLKSSCDDALRMLRNDIRALASKAVTQAALAEEPGQVVATEEIQRAEDSPASE